ncbi:MAG: hypothetical protein IJG40_04065 [Oscillospiraceae bacterium]|nr:hypothetical protein [Oscillospiraceae bacterium]
MNIEDISENNCAMRIDNCELELPKAAPEAHYTVYKLTDPEGKIYIGCTGIPVEKRWLNGRGYHKGTPIRNAIIEFGWKNFKKEILCEHLIKEGAEKLEKWFIAFYDSSDPSKGYNRFLGGLGKGVRMSDITKKISSEAKNRLYDEHPEVVDKIRDTVNNLYETDPTYRGRIAAGVRAAYEKDPTIKVRLSEISKGLWQDPDFRERCSAARRAASEDPELAGMQSMIQRRNYAKHPERREEVSRRMREYLSKPGNRAFVESDSRAKPVICVETGEYFSSQHAAEKATGFVSIHKVCGGKQLTSGGYHWRYAEEIL